MSDLAVQSPESMRLSGLDETMAALNTELSCLNLLAFHRNGTTITGANQQLLDWQKGTTEHPLVELPYAAQRKNAERLAKFGLLARGLDRIGREGHPYSLTLRGVFACALAGFNLELALDPEIQSMSSIYGDKVRRITDTVDDDSEVLSSPLFRSLLLIKVVDEVDTKGHLKAKDVGNIDGIDRVKIVSKIKSDHAEDLVKAGLLELTKKGVRHGRLTVRTNYLSPTDTGRRIATALRSNLSGLFFIDDNWPDVVNLGLQKAREITGNPDRVAKLLGTWLSGYQPAYEVTAQELVDKAIELATTQGSFTCGEFLRFLGGNHDTPYISSRLGGLVASGLLKTAPLKGSNRYRFSLPS